MSILSQTTLSSLLERDLFQRRMEENKPIALNEFFYPILQGYDSVALNVDGEVGGSDQLFNMMVGREFLKKYKNKEKSVITLRLLEDPITKKKMSKSEGMAIGLKENPQEMFGKIMSLPDGFIKPCLELCTEISNDEIKNILSLSPRKAKEELAKIIVTMHHGKEKAKKAALFFDKTFVKKEIPKNIPLLKVKEGDYSIIELLVGSGIISSKSEAKRLVEQGAIEIGGLLINDLKLKTTIKEDVVIKIGKHRFLKIAVKH